MPLRIRLICSGKLIPAIDKIAASLFPLSDYWLSAISYLQREPHMEMDKPHFFVLSRWKRFLKFKGRGPFKFSKKYPAAKHYTDIYRLVLLLTHLSFRWTVPLISSSPWLINTRDDEIAPKHIMHQIIFCFYRIIKNVTYLVCLFDNFKNLTLSNLPLLIVGA